MSESHPGEAVLSPTFLDTVCSQNGAPSAGQPRANHRRAAPARRASPAARGGGASSGRQVDILAEAYLLAALDCGWIGWATLRVGIVAPRPPSYWAGACGKLLTTSAGVRALPASVVAG